MVEPAARFHEARVNVRPWLGTPDRITRAVSRAAEVIAKDVRADSSETIPLEAAFVYADGRDAFTSLRALSQAAAEIPAHKVRAFEATLSWGSPEHKVTFKANDDLGVLAVVSSPDETLALGLREMLRNALEENRAPFYEDTRRRLRSWEWVLGIGLFALAAYICVDFVTDKDWRDTLDGGTDEPMVAITGLFVLILVGFPSLYFYADTLKPRRGVRFVAVELPRDERRPGVTLRAQAWLREHPLVSVVLGFVLGVFSDVVADVLF